MTPPRVDECVLVLEDPDSPDCVGLVGRIAAIVNHRDHAETIYAVDLDGEGAVNVTRDKITTEADLQEAFRR